MRHVDETVLGVVPSKKAWKLGPSLALPRACLPLGCVWVTSFCFWIKGVCLPMSIKAQSNISQQRKGFFLRKWCQIQSHRRVVLKDLVPRWLLGDRLYRGGDHPSWWTWNCAFYGLISTRVGDS